VEEIASLIRRCPDWADVRQGDVTTRRRIISVLKTLSTFDLDILRAAIQLCLEDQHSCRNKLFVLNRYLFSVPTIVDAHTAGRFGGWLIPEIEGGRVELWPLSYTPMGNLQLTGVYMGYIGPSYLALEEFDYFRSTYGPRSKRQKENENNDTRLR
jgi:hypothetical protein